MAAWSELIATLNTHGVEFTDPLSDRELTSAEQLFDFRFPTDLRAFLQTAMPTGKHFPDWRACDGPHLNDWLSRPREVCCLMLHTTTSGSLNGVIDQLISPKQM